MAEGLCRHFQGDRFEAHSAGIETHGLNPLAVQVMADIGIDISGHASKSVQELSSLDFDLVVTVCDHASETCPVFPGAARIVHRGFDDPPKLAAQMSSDAEALECYSRVRDEIMAYVFRLHEE
jgi:arsenate reductase